MKKVLESELLAQLRRDVIDAAVRMAYARTNLIVSQVENYGTVTDRKDFDRQITAQKNYQKALYAFEMVARENLTTLPDEA